MKRSEILYKEDAVTTGTVTSATGNEVEITDPTTKVKTTVPTNSPMLGKDAEGNLVLHDKPNAAGTQTAPGQPPKPEPIKPGTKVAIASEDAECDDNEATGGLSPVSGHEDHDEVSKLLVQKLRKLAGL